jgi:hypothetical protein
MKISKNIRNQENKFRKYPKEAYKSSLYTSWDAMTQRCKNKNSRAYKNYGDRGIRVCESWKEFGNFYSDIIENIGNRPKNKTLDRIDNNKNYSCGKCEECLKNKWQFNSQWSTGKEQCRNMRKNLWFTGFGERKCLKDWMNDSRNLISSTGIISRLKNGWSVEDALTIPSHKKRKGALTYNGITKNKIDWEKDLGLPKGIISTRLLRGWSIDEALNTEPLC